MLDVDQSQFIGGMQMQTIGQVKLLGEMQSNYWGDISPPFPRVKHPCPQSLGLCYNLLIRVSWTISQRTGTKGMGPVAVGGAPSAQKFCIF